jgi:DNA end-binding protein Ku
MAPWKGSLSVGLLSLPVRLHKAADEKAPAFKQLHQADSSPVGRRMYCKGCGNDVSMDEIVKGYQLDSETFIPITDDDLDALPVATKKVVQIDQFVYPDEIDAAMFLGRSYYIQPEDASKKAYGLLLGAMLGEGKAGLCRIAFRESRERLGLLRARNDLLVLDLLFWPDEVRQADSYVVPGGSKAETDLARQLIAGLSAPFQPEEHRDRYREMLLERIEAKVAGTEVPAAKTTSEAPVVEFMEALKASVEQTKKKAPVRKRRAS